MERMSRRRVGESEPRPVDAHRAVVDRQHADVWSAGASPRRAASRRHARGRTALGAVSPGSPASAGYTPSSSLIALKSTTGSRLRIQQRAVHEGVDLIRAGHCLGGGADSLRSSRCAVGDEVMKQRHERRLQWRWRNAMVTHVLLHGEADLHEVTGAHQVDGGEPECRRVPRIRSVHGDATQLSVCLHHCARR